jgi:hypothetical protein
VLLNGNGVAKGLYTAGWVKTGPKGLLANTISNCDETVATIMRDIQNKEMELKDEGKAKYFNLSLNLILIIRFIKFHS